jgi:hypothetical protein
MAALLAKYRLVVAIVGFIAGLGGLWGAYAWADGNGYRRADAAWQIKWLQRELELERKQAEELRRQQYWNDVAKAQELAEIEAYKRRLADLARLVEELTQEAADDPNADRICLDEAAVGRYVRRVTP